ncbi:MAG: hypothetical protein DWQ35_00470 [Planctomycetota bacterium]|nr:MAG: hypothetical protein DWQ35_00470 [Planctomycetota bacterium]
MRLFAASALRREKGRATSRRARSAVSGRRASASAAARRSAATCQRGRRVNAPVAISRHRPEPS